MDTIRPLYDSKPPAYFANARDAEVAPMLGKPRERAFELGCGDGSTLFRLKQQGMVLWAAGIEINTAAASSARGRLDQVIAGNIESVPDAALPDDLDLILCLDVLEHLVDPWSTLKRLAARLRPGGIAIASIPNIRHVGTLAPLLLGGRFDYTQAGTLDRGHLRFFTRRSAQALFEEAGLRVDRIEAPVAGKSALLNALMLGFGRDLCAYQFRIRAEKPAAPP
jgi:2-polyprenyl-3-methyl-5-hydroxy-6-metoxy-1,4-benzoquinol methylase